MTVTELENEFNKKVIEFIEHDFKLDKYIPPFQYVVNIYKVLTKKEIGGILDIYV